MALSNFFANLKPHGIRKIVDLIYIETHGLFVNLDPMSPIQVGSYGEVNKDTGRFDINGNIYDDFPTDTYQIPRAVERVPDEKLIVSSSNGLRTDFPDNNRSVC